MTDIGLRLAQVETQAETTGVIPETRSGRLFRDEIGSLNARMAQVCDEVLLVVAGLATRLK